jgi:hypothetical protein
MNTFEIMLLLAALAVGGAGFAALIKGIRTLKSSETH